jgi:RNA polymerase sigma factor (sigma-70 family)
MALTVSTALEQVAAREGELARSLHAQFRRRLTADDARDAVADAIATAHMSRAELAELDGDRLEAWVRTRAYRNAIDQIRAIDGYGKERRQANVSVDDYAESIADPAAADPLTALGDALADRLTADDTAARSVAMALERLTPDERRLLRLRHYEGLDVKTIASLLDIHPKKYERLHTRAVGKLRTIFIETTASEHCEPVRALIAQSRRESLAPALSAEVAAHVEACAQCRAFEKRSLKLIAMLPLPAPAFADRFWSRLHDLIPGLGGHAEVAAASAGSAVGAGGAVTGTGLIAGVGAKALAVICGSAVTATCVGAVAIPAIKHGVDKPRKPASAKSAAAKQRAQASRPRTVAPPAAVATAARATTPGSGVSTVRKKAAGRRSTPKITGSLSLEDFGTPTIGGGSTPAPSGGSTRRTSPPPPPAPSSRFSGEFAP